MQTRRQFLSTQLTGALAASLFPTLFARAARTASVDAAPDAQRVLLLVRLGGGNDGLNTVVPADDDRYHRARPSLAVPKATALPLADGLFLHPSLARLKELFDRRRLCVLNSIGYPMPDRSHFRSMDIWHTASLAPETVKTGWLGRMLDQEPNDAALAAAAVVDDVLPLAMIGERAAVPVIPGLEEFLIDARCGACADLARVGRTSATPALSFVVDRMSDAVDAARRVAERCDGGRHPEGFPRSKLGRHLATVAALLNADLGSRVFYVAHDGFDTHTQQQDAHAALLRDLGDSLAAFTKRLEADGMAERVLIVTFSEFGRRVQENASLGTDHGHGAPMFVIGPSIARPIVGGAPDLADLDDGDVKGVVDFRRVYAALLQRWFGLPAPAVAKLLRGEFEPLPFLAAEA